MRRTRFDAPPLRFGAVVSGDVGTPDRAVPTEAILPPAACIGVSFLNCLSIIDKQPLKSSTGCSAPASGAAQRLPLACRSRAYDVVTPWAVG
jgi:hypothetical protein